MLSAALALILSAVPVSADVAWSRLAEGVEYAAIGLDPAAGTSEAVLHVVRIDPSRAKVRALAASQADRKMRTARQWREEQRLVAVINAGMYDVDYSTHTGFFRLGEHVNSARWVKSYQSVLLLGPRKPGLPLASIEDAAPGASGSSFGDHETVIQNLRLIRAPGASVWKENGRRWSEAALATDSRGRLLFLFCRAPFSMNELNARLLALPLGIVRAMHLEGGPEASLSVRGGGISLDLSGSYETGFHEQDANAAQWPLPNVLGVEAKP